MKGQVSRLKPQAEYFRRKKILAVILLVVVGFITGSCQPVRRDVKKLRITNGVAVSLNSLERTTDKNAMLPPMDIKGISIDRARNDWVIFGDYNSEAKRLPVDAVRVAIRAIRLYLEAPGVDIRPRSAADKNSQVVTYFGGVASTEVGLFFYIFDYWMKQAALGEAPVIPQVPVYWQRVVHSAESQDLAIHKPQAQGTRFWLCAGDFTAKEEKDTLTFESTPLVVLSERLRDSQSARRAPPCATQGTDDRFADEFARALAANLDNLQGLTPISEIKSFARLFAAMTWALQRDPYRDLNPWLNGTVKPVRTPSVVPTISKQHRVVQRDERVIRQLRLEVSGGVTIAPKLLKERGYELLLRLQRAVLGARPAEEAVTWPFTFDSTVKK